jgi:hypothetical protein
MSAFSNALRAGLVAAGVIGLSATAAAAAPSTGNNCFFISEWQGWKSPSPNILYLGVNHRDIYKVELSGGSPELSWPDVHLISKVTGSDSICSPLDLQLYVSDNTGFRSALIARSLTKLTPEEVAAIPRKDRP